MYTVQDTGVLTEECKTYVAYSFPDRLDHIDDFPDLPEPIYHNPFVLELLLRGSDHDQVGRSFHGE